MENDQGLMTPVIQTPEVQAAMEQAKIAGEPMFLQLCQLSAHYAGVVDTVVVNSDEDYKKLSDSIKAVKEALKIAEQIRKAKVKFPWLVQGAINGLFKPLKDQLVSVRDKLDRKAIQWTDKKDAEDAAAKIEAEEKLRENETCNTCLSMRLIGGVDVCYMVQQGISTPVTPETKACTVWAPRSLIEVPEEGETAVLHTEPLPPPPPPNQTVKGEGSSLTMRKVWDYEVKDFGKFVRAVGSNSHPELVPENLLELRRGEILKIISRDEERVTRIAGLKIFQKKVPTSR